MLKLILATTNTGKIIEIKEKFNDGNINIESLLDYPEIPEIEEDGNTFLENSLIKAKAVLCYTHLPVLADDSGLEIYYLKGKPGIYSSRWGKTDQERIERVLNELKEASEEQRKARFVCVMCFVTPEGNIYTSEGICSGKIIFQPVGCDGFGYDPIFVPDGYNLTFSQLGRDIKNRISHRAIALKKIIPKLNNYFYSKIKNNNNI